MTGNRQGHIGIAMPIFPVDVAVQAGKTLPHVVLGLKYGGRSGSARNLCTLTQVAPVSVYQASIVEYVCGEGELPPTMLSKI